MHHGIIIKVWAEDEDSALQEALEALEESIDQSNNTCGWDYVNDGNTYVIKDPKQVSSPSFAAFEVREKKSRKTTLKELIQNFEEALKVILADDLLTKKDAALCLHDPNDDFKTTVEKRLKAPKDITFPPYPDLVKIIAEKIASGLEIFSGNLLYLIKRINRLQKCMEDPLLLSSTLQCTDNGYAEIECENKTNKHPYFVFGDRHI